MNIFLTSDNLLSFFSTFLPEILPKAVTPQFDYLDRGTSFGLIFTVDDDNSG